MRVTFGRTTATLLGAAALALGAGCGDDGGGSGGDDAKDIEAVIVEALTTKDADVKCTKVVTKGFVSTVYGSLAQCKKAEAPEPDDDPKPTGASISGLKVDGGTASATVTVEGGVNDGASGPISFEQEDDEWKVSELSATFLRSQLKTSFAQSTFDEDDGPLADEKVRTCISDGLQGLDDTAFRTLAYAAIADGEPDPKFVEIVTTCSSNSTDATGDDTSDDTATTPSSDDSAEAPSLLRTQFEAGIRQAAKKDGATDEQIDCVVKELRTSITDDEIVEQIGKGKDVSADLQQKTARAIQKCG